VRFLKFLKSVVNYTCPKCRTGELFIKPLQLSKPLDMPERCAHCNQKTSPEPGFYFGAMFISYIISGILFLAIGLPLVFYFKWGVNPTIFLVVIVFIITYLPLMRFSRSMWIHMIVRYDPDAADNT